MSDIEGDFYLPEQEVLGGWATVFFKNRKIPMFRRVRLARFQKQFGVWKDDAAGMICKCAEADALRSSFPSMLGGLYLREEQEVDVRMIPTKPNFEKPATAVSFPTVEAIESNAIAEPPKSGFARPEPSQTQIDLGQEAPPDDGDPFADQQAEAGPEPEPKDDWRKLPVILGKHAGKPFGSISEKELRWWVETWQPNVTKPLQLEVRRALNLAAIELGMVAPQEPNSDVAS